jgi:coenzyme F420-reducing hydrogenase gamma subunit
MKKVKVATVWLDGCSGCHMSLLDMDAAIISLAQKIDLVYGPLVDAQEFPEDVDVTLVEGAVSSQDDVNKLRKVRQRTHLLISLGDCAVTGKCAGHAKFHSGKQTAAADLCGRGARGQSDSDGRSAPVVETGATAARVRESGYVSAGMSATGENNRSSDFRSGGREKARGRLRREIRMRSAG